MTGRENGATSRAPSRRGRRRLSIQSSIADRPSESSTARSARERIPPGRFVRHEPTTPSFGQVCGTVGGSNPVQQEPVDDAIDWLPLPISVPFGISRYLRWLNSNLSSLEARGTSSAAVCHLTGVNALRLIAAELADPNHAPEAPRGQHLTRSDFDAACERLTGLGAALKAERDACWVHFAASALAKPSAAFPVRRPIRPAPR
jgi:hypothetical protein